METPNYVPASHRKAKGNKYRISFHGLLRMLSTPSGCVMDRLIMG